MQAYAEGFEIMHASDYDARPRARSPTLWNHGSVVRSWLLELAERAFAANGQDLDHLKGWVADSGEGRWTVQEAIDHDVPAPVITLVAPDPVPLAPGRLVRRQGPRRAPQRVRRPRGEDRVAGRDHDRRPEAGGGARRRSPDRRRRRPARTGSPARSRRRTRRGRCASCGSRARASAGAAPPKLDEPAPRGAPPGAHAGPVRPRPVRGDRRPRPPQGHPGALPAVADEPPAPRVHARGDRPAAVRRRDVPGRDPGRRSRRTRRVRRRAGDRGASSSSGSSTTQGDFADAAAFDALATRLDEHRPRARHRAATGSSTSRPSRRPSPRSSPSSGGSGSTTSIHGGGWRRIVIEKPFGRDLDSAIRLNREVAQGLPRVAGLPDRPLPRQGDRPEPAGLPLRQRDLRAALEPALRRPRPDHGGRVDRRREPRRVLRGDRRGARHPPEPPPAAAQRSSRWSRRRRSRRTRSATRRSRSSGRSPRPRRDEVARRRRPRPVRPGLGRRRSRSPATARSRTSTRSPRPRRSSRRGSTIDDWRWAGVPFYLRTGKRLPKRATRDRDPVPAGPPPAVQGQLGRPRAEPARAPDPARRGDPPALRRQGARARARRPGGQHGLHLRLGVQRRLARRLRDAHPRRAARRRVAVHPGRRGRGGVGHRDARSSTPGSSSRAPDFPNYEAGSWGPSAADELLERDGRRWRRI